MGGVKSKKIKQAYIGFALRADADKLSLNTFKTYKFSQEKRKPPTLTLNTGEHTVKISYSNDANHKLTVEITHNGGDGLDVDGRDVRTFTEATSDNRPLTKALKLLGDKNISDAYLSLT